MIPKTYRNERTLRAASDKFLKCRIREQDLSAGPTRGLAKKTREGRSDLTRDTHDPYLTGHDPTRLLRFFVSKSDPTRPERFGTRPDPTRSDP